MDGTSRLLPCALPFINVAFTPASRAHSALLPSVEARSRRATAKPSLFKFWLHDSLHRRLRVFNSLLERAALLFNHVAVVALTLPLSFNCYAVGQRAFLRLQSRRKACQRPPSARDAARGTCKHSLCTASPSPRLPRHAPNPGRLRSKINYRICFPLYPYSGLPPMR